MNNNNFSIKIASDTDKEKVFAEIYYQNNQWAEISQEGESPIITLFSPIYGEHWEFPLQDAIEAINQAKKRLLGE